MHVPEPVLDCITNSSVGQSEYYLDVPCASAFVFKKRFHHTILVKPVLVFTRMNHILEICRSFEL